MAIVINKGEDVNLKVRVTDKVTGAPYNFSGFSGATAQFYKEDDTALSVTGTNPETNVLEFDLSEAQTALLKAGDVDFQYQWMQDGKLSIEITTGEMSVLDTLFP